MTKRTLSLAFAAMLATGAVAATAHAESRDQDRQDVAALAAMKVTLPQAIATAEQHSGGRAVGADILQQNGPNRIAIEVAGPQGVKTITVDGMTGQVTATRDGGNDTEDND